MENTEAKQKNKRKKAEKPSETIFNLAKEAGYKKIMVRLESWPFGNWCIVNLIYENIYNDGGSAYGHVKRSNGEAYNGKIIDAEKSVWQMINVLDEDMTVKRQNMPKYKVNDKTPLSHNVKLMYRLKNTNDKWSVWGWYELTPQEMERVLIDRNKEAVQFEWKFEKSKQKQP